MSRTIRRQYRDARKNDETCRAHGTDGFFRKGRLFFDRKRREAARVDLAEWRAHAMTEEELRTQLDEAKALRREVTKYSDAWAALCVEMGRITAAIWRLRQDIRRKESQSV